MSYHRLTNQSCPPELKGSAHTTPDRNAVLHEALTKAAVWFEEYAFQHRCKATQTADDAERVSRLGKSKRNKERAEYLRAALSTTPEPTDPAGVSEMVEEIAWLVEFPPAGDSYKGGQRVGPSTPTQYYCAVWRNGRLLSRTGDPNEAMRFARQQDALAMIERLNDDSEFRGYGRTGAFAVEHMWINSGPALRTPNPVLEVAKEALEVAKRDLALIQHRIREKSYRDARQIAEQAEEGTRAALQTIGAGQ